MIEYWTVAKLICPVVLCATEDYCIRGRVLINVGKLSNRKIFVDCIVPGLAGIGRLVDSTIRRSIDDGRIVGVKGHAMMIDVDRSADPRCLAGIPLELPETVAPRYVHQAWIRWMY